MVQVDNTLLDAAGTPIDTGVFLAFAPGKAVEAE
jgi:hypothetical protein